MRRSDNETSTILSATFLEDQSSRRPTGKMTSRQEGMSFSKRALIAITLSLTVLGMAVGISADLLPSWQVVHLFEYNSVHEHGLWLDCTRHSRDEIHIMRRYHTDSESLNCVYKWDYDETSDALSEDGGDTSPVGEVNRHRFYGWQVATLILLGLSFVISIISLCVGCCSCTHRHLTLVTSTITLLNFFLSSVAIGVFFFYSHRADNRFINGIVGTYEQRVGLAFFLGIGACIFHFIAFLISILTVFITFSNGHGEGDYVDRTSRLSINNLYRAADVEPPLLFQDSKNAAARSPPNYTKYNVTYSKLPTSSMPDISTTNLRRSSETCV